MPFSFSFFLLLFISIQFHLVLIILTIDKFKIFFKFCKFRSVFLKRLTMDKKYNDEDFERWRNELEDVSSDEEEKDAEIKKSESKITHFVIDNLKRKFHADYRKLINDFQSLTALGAEIHRNSLLIDYLESRTDIHCANCLLCQSCHSKLTPIHKPLINYLSKGNGNVEDRGKLML